MTGVNEQKKIDFSRRLWCVLGLPFDIVDYETVISSINGHIDSKKRCFLSTPNTNFLIKAQADQKFFQSVVDSDLIIADGMPIIWVAKLLSIPLVERVAGSDVFDGLSRQKVRDKKISVFFFGGNKGVAERASQKLDNSSTAMTCCGYYDPGFVPVDEMSTDEIINHVNASKADFLLVALGAGKGQAWIQKNRHQLNASVVSHLGAVINFVEGRVKRAPVFLQENGFEWLWRIKQEPALYSRYLFDGLIFIRLVVCKVLPLAVYDRWLKRSDALNTPVVISQDPSNTNTVRLIGSIHGNGLEPIKECFSNILEQERDSVVLDFSKLEYIDGAFIALLMLFQRYLNEQNCQLSILNMPKRIERLLYLNNATSRFKKVSDNN